MPRSWRSVIRCPQQITSFAGDGADGRSAPEAAIVDGKTIGRSSLAADRLLILKAQCDLAGHFQPQLAAIDVQHADRHLELIEATAQQ